MVTKLEDFLRRRSKIALVTRHEDIRNAEGLMEACAILFEEQAQAKFDEYFAHAHDKVSTKDEHPQKAA
jgi:glycerol-3-phosphate dehydrogenase